MVNDISKHKSLVADGLRCWFFLITIDIMSTHNSILDAILMPYCDQQNTRKYP